MPPVQDDAEAAADSEPAPSADEQAADPASDDSEEEYYELEFDEDSVVGYLVDEDDNEIGVIVEEDGTEVEYYYADDEGTFVDAEDASASKGSDGEEYDLGITREGVAEFTSDANAIFKDGVAIASELKEAMGDITESLGAFKRKK